MKHPLADLFDTELTPVPGAEPRIAGPWRKPVHPFHVIVPPRRSDAAVARALLEGLGLDVLYLTEHKRGTGAPGAGHDVTSGDAHPLPAPPRPWWMSALAAFCLASVAFLLPRDLFFPETRDVEVWFGFEVRGALAVATAPLHWAIFLVGAWGFWTQRRWILPAASAYAFYVAFSHLVWSEASPNGRGLATGLAQAALLSVPGILLWRASRRKTGRERAGKPAL